MNSRRVSVRLVAEGGQVVRTELDAIGRAGTAAMETLTAATLPASRGLGEVGQSAGTALARLDALAAKAAQTAASLRAMGTSTGSVLDRVNQATGATPKIERDAADIEAYGRALDDLRAKHNPVYAAIRSYRAALADIRQAHRVGAISAEEMTAAIGRERRAALASIAALKGQGGALRQMGDNSRFAAFQSRNLLFQLNDIGVSLAGGMSPMTVLVQQGGQIAQMYAGQGGVNAALRQTAGLIGGVITRFPLLTAAIALGTAALAGMTHEINAMGGTTVSFGDTALAVWQAVGDGLRSILKPAVDAVAPWFSAAWNAVVAGVKVAGNAIINGFRAAFVAVGAVWSGLPTMIGEAVTAAANAVVAGTEAMINAVIDRINRFVAGLNEALSALPAWATGGAALQIGTLGNVTLGRVGNPYAGTAEDSASRVRGQISAIMADDPLGGLFDSIRQRATANAAARAAAEDKAGVAAGRAGKAAKQASEEAANARDAELTGIDAITAALARYGTEAANIGKGIGEALAGGFSAAEEAVGRFVRTGKLDVRDLVSSLLADMAKLSVRKAILGPIAERISGWLSGAAAGGGFLATWLGGGTATASVLHAGGRVGTGPMRALPAAAFLHAPRFHNGGGFGLRPDEQAAILQRGERVLSRRETRDWEAGAGAQVNIHVRDAQSFRQSRAQVAADIARAVAFGRRSS